MNLPISPLAAKTNGLIGSQRVVNKRNITRKYRKIRKHSPPCIISFRYCFSWRRCRHAPILYLLQANVIEVEHHEIRSNYIFGGVNLNYFYRTNKGRITERRVPTIDHVLTVLMEFKPIDYLTIISVNSGLIY